MKHIFAVSALAGTACLQHCMFVQCFFLPRFLGAYVTLLKYAERTYSRNDRAAL